MIENYINLKHNRVINKKVYKICKLEISSFIIKK